MKDRTCFLAPFTSRPCDGRLVKVHLIPRRKLRELWRTAHHGAVQGTMPTRTLEALIAHDGAWVWGCGGPSGSGGHHGMLDIARTLRIPRTSLPEATEELAAALGIAWWLDREYGP